MYSGPLREMYASGGGGGGGGRPCYVCGELGHFARDCCRRAVVGGRGSGPFCCFVCGKPGHLARYCHKRARPNKGSSSSSSGGGGGRGLGRGRSRAVDREQGHLTPNSDQTSVGVTREPESLAPSGSQRVGAIAFEISHSFSSDDDEDDDDDDDDDEEEEEEEEKRVVVESTSNGCCSSSSTPRCRLLHLAFELMREKEKDDDNDDDCIILDYDPFQPPTVDYQNKFSPAVRNKDISVVAEQGQLALSSGDPIRKEISSLSSNEEDDDDDDDDDDYDDDYYYDDDDDDDVVSKKSTGFLNAEVRVKEEKMREEDWEDDDSCIILDFDPFQPPTADFENKLSLSDHHPSDLQNEDIFVISERGQVACRDYPHSRYHCAKYPFSKSDHESCCPQCYCYVCDVVAPCEHWKGSNGHCHASNDDSTWRARRMLNRLDDDIFG